MEGNIFTLHIYINYILSFRDESFIVESFMYSIIAVIITSGLLVPIYFTMLPKISNYLTPGSNIFDGNIAVFAGVVGIQLAIAFVLSTISSLLAMRKYLQI